MQAKCKNHNHCIRAAHTRTHARKMSDFDGDDLAVDEQVRDDEQEKLNLLVLIHEME